MTHARIRIDPTDVVGDLSPRVFGTFVEHMGRCVYGGIHDPQHPSADADGFRGDVLALVRELGATVVRYPGGNFVSGFRWEDSVGPREERPVRLDAAWHSIETNQVGLHEFAGWAERAGLEVMMAVNLGTRGAAEAAQLLEYCNHPGGTALSDQRRANGAADPFGFRLWCLGNEMDGDWQIGHKTAHEYGRLAAETARLMRFVDPTVELVAAGSSSADQPTFGEWEREVVRLTAGLVDHVSLHAYYEEKPGDLASFLASGVGLDRYIETVAAILDEEEAALGERTQGRRLGISVDEWNVWYLDRFNEQDKEPLLTGAWNVAPRIIEDEYAVADAVVVESLLNSLVRHADRVTMANQAQLVNVIAPIRTEPDADAWRQTICWPFAVTAARARGAALRVAAECPTVPTDAYGDVPVVDVVATTAGDRVEVFCVNRDPENPVEVTLAGAHGALRGAHDAVVLTVPEGHDRFVTNTRDAQPVGLRELDVRVEDGEVRLTLPALSWAALGVVPA